MITEEQLALISSIIKKTASPQAILLFGSYAKGTAHSDSDVDIAVIKSTIQDKHKELFGIRKALFNYWIPMDIILLDEDSFVKRRDIYGTLQYEIAHFGKQIG